SAGTSYSAFDVVTENGSTYEATTSTQEDPATSVAGNDGNWVVFALAGATGAQGIQGPQGAVGANGATGATGADGAIGPQGPSGAVGATGATGQGFNFRGAFSAGTSYSAFDVVTENGSTYEATTSTQEDPATSVAGNDGNWVVFALAGATGAQGIQGPQGAVGANGATGATGADGAIGPQGPSGAVGATGATGQGFNFRGAFSAGTSYSAFDVVTENGSTYEATTSTQEDPATSVAGNDGNWVVFALAGATGAQGIQGPQGAVGANGATGATGADGAIGPQGPSGAVGATGATGQGFNFRGAFSAGTSYSAFDV